MAVIIIMMVFIVAVVCLVTSLYVKTYQKELDKVQGEFIKFKDEVKLLKYHYAEVHEYLQDMEEEKERQVLEPVSRRRRKNRGGKRDTDEDFNSDGCSSAVGL